MKIAIGTDHAGYELKEMLKTYLVAEGFEVIDFGVDSPEPSDYPDVAAPVAKAVAQGQVDRGVLICGSGVGVCVVANKVAGIRAALAWNPEIARLSREHNDANVLCLASRFTTDEMARDVVRTWLDTPFSSEERHVRRIAKVSAIEEGMAKES